MRMQLFGLLGAPWPLHRCTGREPLRRHPPPQTPPPLGVGIPIQLEPAHVQQKCSHCKSFHNPHNHR